MADMSQGTESNGFNLLTLDGCSTRELEKLRDTLKQQTDSAMLEVINRILDSRNSKSQLETSLNSLQEALDTNDYSEIILIVNEVIQELKVLGTTLPVEEFERVKNLIDRITSEDENISIAKNNAYLALLGVAEKSDKDES